MVHQENLKTEKSTSFSIWNMKSISLCFKTFSYPPVRLKEWGFCFSKAICYTCRLIRTHSRQQKWGADNVKMLCRSIAQRRPVFLSCTSSLDLRLEAFLLEFGGAHSFWHWKHMVENSTVSLRCPNNYISISLFRKIGPTEQSIINLFKTVTVWFSLI